MSCQRREGSQWIPEARVDHLTGHRHNAPSEDLPGQLRTIAYGRNAHAGDSFTYGLSWLG